MGFQSPQKWPGGGWGVTFCRHKPSLEGPKPLQNGEPAPNVARGCLYKIRAPNPPFLVHLQDYKNQLPLQKWGTWETKWETSKEMCTIWSRCTPNVQPWRHSASRCEAAGCTVRAFAIRWWQPAGFSAIFLLLLLLLLLFLFLVKMAGYLLPSPFFLIPSSAFRLPSSFFRLPSPSPSFSFSFSFFFLFISFFFPLKPWHRFNRHAGAWSGPCLPQGLAL